MRFRGIRAGVDDGVVQTPQGPGFTVAAVIVFNADGDVLTVRKRGTTMFMLPGGKVEPGETPDRTAVREVAEELSLTLDAARLEPVGEFLTDAANEPGYWLRSFVYAWPDLVTGEQVASEIEESRWIDPDAPGLGDLAAPLFIELLPEIRSRR